MKISITSLLLLVLSTTPASALYVEETGVNDFSISTTGHGSVSFVHSTATSVITSSHECTVASRSLDSGKLLWRREVCTSTEDESPSHLMAVSGGQFYTADDAVRAWSADTGALLWDAPPTDVPTKGLWVASSGAARNIVASTDGVTLALYNAANGRSLGRVSGDSWVGVVSGNDEGSLFALSGSVSDDGLVKDVSKVSLVLSDDDGATMGESKRMDNVKEAFVASSLTIEGDYAFALTADGKLMRFSVTNTETSEVSAIDHPLWTSVEKLEVLSDSMIRVSGSDNRYTPAKESTALFVNSGSEWTQVYTGAEESEYEAIAHCSDADLVVAAFAGSLQVFSASDVKSTPKALTIEVDSKDVVSIDTVSCQAGSMSVLVSTSKLASGLVNISADGTATKVWSSEDGLSSVSSALLLDAIHSIDLSVDEEAEVMNKLGLASRLESQVEAAINLFAHLAVSDTRDDDFGFVKVAVLLSQKVNRVWGLPTTGEKRGEIDWKIDLPSDAKWHTMVHGTASANAIVHGINGGTHSPDVLVISSKADETAWTCIDGSTGEVHGTGASASSAPVVQIVPVFGGGACRQVAVLIHEDQSVSVVPDDAKSMAAVKREMSKSQNGFYNHVINRDTNSLETFTLMGSDKGFDVQRVAHTGFTGEKIVQVGYPQRDEVVQSPSSVLGDDSILLKYLNPHIAVVVTMSEAKQDTTDPIVAALGSKGSAGKRKPVGATPPGDVPAEASQGDDEPNLFVNIVDTVSGRILHRVSHANAAANSKIPTLITENWIIYAFFNSKSRRTELGVLTLYEGMIDKAGLTAFTSPEQALTFSSLDPRQSKPVVLSKTYAIVKPVTALGVTSTRAGISTRQILIASADDRITAVSRHLLEPRRPTGKVKDTEKQEGLFQYSPLVPLISMSSPSYNQTVQQVSTIVSAPTALESQSLILAFGGPDVFFSRVSPSKGFDLLPDTFNRPLLSIVVFGLVTVVIVVRNRSQKKMVMNGWA